MSLIQDGQALARVDLVLRQLATSRVNAADDARLGADATRRATGEGIPRGSAFVRAPRPSLPSVGRVQRRGAHCSTNDTSARGRFTGVRHVREHRRADDPGRARGSEYNVRVARATPEARRTERTKMYIALAATVANRFASGAVPPECGGLSLSLAYQPVRRGCIYQIYSDVHSGWPLAPTRGT